MAETLSDKVLRTLREMGTEGSAWSVPPTETQNEKRLVPTQVRCPVCEGGKYVIKDAAGRAIHRDDPNTPEARAARSAMHKRGDDGTCPRCVNRVGRPTGEVTELRERVVPVVYIRWPAGTLFDSRFIDGCMACGKRNVENVVPMVAYDAAGRPHGMWVGVDCARKFLALSAAEIKRLTGGDTVLARS
jgi:hypothetical protein